MRTIRLVSSVVYGMLMLGAAMPAAAAKNDAGVVVTSITAGFADPNGVVPGFDVANGAGTPTWDIAVPRGVLRIGSNYVYSMTMQNTTYSGKCTASFALTQDQNGTTVTLDSGVFQNKFGCAAAEIYGWALSGKVIPNSPGAATLTAKVDFGKKSTALSVPVFIEQ